MLCDTIMSLKNRQSAENIHKFYNPKNHSDYDLVFHFHDYYFTQVTLV
jgi:hypothetical protein